MLLPTLKGNHKTGCCFFFKNCLEIKFTEAGLLASSLFMLLLRPCTSVLQQWTQRARDYFLFSVSSSYSACHFFGGETSSWLWPMTCATFEKHCQPAEPPGPRPSPNPSQLMTFPKQVVSRKQTQQQVQKKLPTS